jgi:hypothetical protein
MASILNVDQINNAAGTSAVTIDSSGRVDMPSTVMYDTYRLTADHTANGIMTAWEKPDNTICTTVGDSMSVSSGIFTFPRTGVYRVAYFAAIDNGAADSVTSVELFATTDNSTYERLVYVREGGSASDADYGTVFGEAVININDVSNRKARLEAGSIGGGSLIKGDTDITETYICFQYLAPAQ